jgi:hypothetical protein
VPVTANLLDVDVDVDVDVDELLAAPYKSVAHEGADFGKDSA